MSEMPKFTAGPWSTPHFAVPDVNCNCRYVLCDHMMGAVASVHCSGPGEDWQAHGDNPRFAEAVANAHLIAAAPELFEALTEARKAVALLEDLTACRADDDYVAQISATIEAALAKASGGWLPPPNTGET